MTPDQLRSRFLSFFAEREHEVVASSPVVPKGDPTLLFTNAGMNQFKDLLLGTEVRDYKRAASAQKCIRAGGKHNDLDEVGRDERHLTFFEMLGNWSFGDYYKEESIRWGWDFVLNEMKLDRSRLYISIYKDDDESFEIWRNLGVEEERILRLGDVDKGDEENFWSMGPTGPCGPCTEIFYDMKPSGEMGWKLGFDEDRYVEFWNHVFMEFDRREDGSTTPLPLKSVDTGMGLERAATILAGVSDVFATELFRTILERTSELLGEKRSQHDILSSDDRAPYCVIADHIRTLTFAVSEGQRITRDGRGYVLRRILRRAVRFGRKLGFEAPFLHILAQEVVDRFGAVYPGIVPVASQTAEIIRLEEERFFRTLDRGIKRFDKAADKIQKKGGNEVPGDVAFELYDTYGFPLDLTMIMAEERGMAVDNAGYDEAMRQAQITSGAQAKFYDEEPGGWVAVRDGSADRFLGYDRDETASRIVRYRTRGEYFELLLDMTPFYPEGGGQVGDTGRIFSEDGNLAFEVLDTQRTPTGIVHLCELDIGFVTEASMRSDVIAEVNGHKRALTAANHTATHLLHAALHNLVSKDAVQAGSLVRHDKLRFDFTHPKSLSRDQLHAIENWVNTRVQGGLPVVQHREVSREEAESRGAMAIFGEKYGDRVRMIEVPGESLELCGGIHVKNTRDILFFRITQEAAIAAGTRRIEAVTHETAYAQAQAEREMLESIQRSLRADRIDQVPDRIASLQDSRDAAERYVEKLFSKVARAEVSRILTEGRQVGDTQVYTGKVEVRDRKELLKIADFLRDRMGDAGIALLGTVLDEKPALVCLVSNALAKANKKAKAGSFVREAAEIVGGRGGGRPTLAQAGGTLPEKLDDALQKFYAIVESALLA